jgi:hypothetical protein
MQVVDFDHLLVSTDTKSRIESVRKKMGQGEKLRRALIRLHPGLETAEVEDVFGQIASKLEASLPVFEHLERILVDQTSLDLDPGHLLAFAGEFCSDALRPDQTSVDLSGSISLDDRTSGIPKIPLKDLPGWGGLKTTRAIPIELKPLVGKAQLHALPPTGGTPRLEPPRVRLDALTGSPIPAAKRGSTLVARSPSARNGKARGQKSLFFCTDDSVSDAFRSARSGRGSKPSRGPGSIVSLKPPVLPTVIEVFATPAKPIYETKAVQTNERDKPSEGGGPTPLPALTTTPSGELGSSFVSIDMVTSPSLSLPRTAVRCRRPFRFLGLPQRPPADPGPGPPTPYVNKSRFIPLVPPKDGKRHSSIGDRLVWTSDVYQKALTSHSGCLDIRMEVSKTRSALVALSREVGDLNREFAILSADAADKFALTHEQGEPIHIFGLGKPRLPLETFADNGAQTDMRNKDVNRMEKDNAAQAAFVAESIRSHQEWMIAQAQLPELQKEVAALRVANILKQMNIARYEVKGASSAALDPELEFQAIRDEKMAVVVDFEKQIETAEAEMAGLKHRIADQRELQVSLKDQVDRKKRSLRRGSDRTPPIVRPERLRQEEFMLLQCEFDQYNRRIHLIGRFLADRTLELTRSVHLLKRKLKSKKLTYAARLDAPNTSKVPLTSPLELTILRGLRAQSRVEYLVDARQSTQASQRVRKFRDIVKSYTPRVPAPICRSKRPTL